VLDSAASLGRKYFGEVSMPESEVEMAERHVREGTEHVLRQRDLVAELKRDGHDITAAVELLNTLETSLQEHIDGSALLREVQAQRESITRV
jgi:hypothetical protein